MLSYLNTYCIIIFIRCSVSVSLIFFGLSYYFSRILKSCPHPGVPNVARVGSRNHSTIPNPTTNCYEFSPPRIWNHHAWASNQNSKSISCSLPADSVMKSQLSHGGRRKWQRRCSPRCPRQAWYMYRDRLKGMAVLLRQSKAGNSVNLGRAF